MTLLELKQQVLFQLGADTADLEEYLPHLNDYLNEGYDQLLMAVRRQHADPDGPYPPLRHDKSQPELPSWMHRAIADYAAWMLCRCGGASRQSRGMALRRSFEETLSRARMGQERYFTNIPN